MLGGVLSIHHQTISPLSKHGVLRSCWLSSLPFLYSLVITVYSSFRSVRSQHLYTVQRRFAARPLNPAPPSPQPPLHIPPQYSRLKLSSSSVTFHHRTFFPFTPCPVPASWLAPKSCRGFTPALNLRVSVSPHRTRVGAATAGQNPPFLTIPCIPLASLA